MPSSAGKSVSTHDDTQSHLAAIGDDLSSVWCGVDPPTQENSGASSSSIRNNGLATPRRRPREFSETAVESVWTQAPKLSAERVFVLEFIQPVFKKMDLQLLLDAVYHKLKPEDLYQLVQRVETVDGGIGLYESKNPAAGQEPKLVEHFPTLPSLVAPLQVYAAVLLTYATSSRNFESARQIVTGFSIYTANLIELERKYPWEFVLKYHICFHRDRLKEMDKGRYSGWLVYDEKLVVEPIPSHPHSDLVERTPPQIQDSPLQLDHTPAGRVVVELTQTESTEKPEPATQSVPEAITHNTAKDTATTFQDCGQFIVPLSIALLLASYHFIRNVPIHR